MLCDMQNDHQLLCAMYNKMTSAMCYVNPLEGPHTQHIHAFDGEHLWMYILELAFNDLY